MTLASKKKDENAKKSIGQKLNSKKSMRPVLKKISGLMKVCPLFIAYSLQCLSQRNYYLHHAACYGLQVSIQIQPSGVAPAIRPESMQEKGKCKICPAVKRGNGRCNC